MAEGVDTSMYGTLQPAGGINYLGMLGQSANIQNALNQNRLFQQEFIGKQAVGGIMKQAIDQYGNVDYKKAALLLSTDARTGYIAPQILQQWANKGLLDAQTTAAELGNYQNRVKIAGDAAGALLNDPNLSSQKVIGKASDVYNNGGFGDPHSEDAKNAYLTFLKRMPMDASGKLIEGPELRNYVTQIAAQADGADKSIGLSLGALKEYNTNAGTQVLGVSQTTGVHPLGFVGNTLTPDQAATLAEVRVTRANAAQYPGASIGSVIKVPRSQLPGGDTVGQPGPVIDQSGLQSGGNQLMQGSPSQSSPGGNQLTGGPAPGATQPVAPALAQGVNPMAPPAGQGGAVPPTQMAAAPPPAQGPGAPNFVPSQLSPMEQKEQENAAEYEAGLNDSVAKMSANMLNVKLLKDAMTHTATGGLMEARGKLGQALQGLGVPKGVYNPESGGSLDANQLIQMKAIPQVFSSLRDLINGAGRFAVLEFKVLQENSPNINTSPGAWKQMLGLTQQVYEVKRLEQQKYRDWITKGNDPADWQVHWTHNLANSPILNNVPWMSESQKSRVHTALLNGSDDLPPPPKSGQQ